MSATSPMVTSAGATACSATLPAHRSTSDRPKRSSWAWTDFLEFRDTYKDRAGRIAAPSNDGMLHIFDEDERRRDHGLRSLHGDRQARCAGIP